MNYDNFDDMDDDLDGFEFDISHVRNRLGDNYVIVDVPTLALKQKLLDFIETEIYPNLVDQQANIL